MKRWFLRNFVCRFRGHAEPVKMPMFRRWFKDTEVGSLHCSRCGKMVGEYGSVYPLFDGGKEIRTPFFFKEKP